MKIYLAGPEVFLTDALDVLANKRAICARMGWEGLSPVDNEIPKTAKTPAEIASAIYEGNMTMMRQADAIIANISPFRGPNMDPGTAFEIGFFAALGKPIMVYTQDKGDLTERVVEWSQPEVTVDGHEIRDRNEHLVEAFGLSENLMIDSAIDNQGVDADVVVSPTAFGERFECVKGFEAACQRLATMLDVAEAFKPQRSRSRPRR